MAQTESPRSLSGTVRVELDTLDAFQAQVALERRRHSLREQADTIATARRLLEVHDPSDDERVLTDAIAQTERALRAVEAAFGYPPMTESEQRLMDGNR